MVDATEAAAGSVGGQFAADLSAGLDVISQNQTIRFTKYIRTVLPFDGYVFWVKADLLNPSPFFGAQFNQSKYNQPQSVETPAVSVEVEGSLHYTTDQSQGEDEGFSVNRVIFTSKQSLDELIDVTDPKSMLIGDFDGMKFAFSKRTMLYRQSGLFHYQGDAIYPSMANLIIEFPEQIDLSNIVVSNSLPIWLTLGNICPMFPSYLVPDDIEPPWCAVHIQPESTTALQAFPSIDPNNGSHYQLCTETVKLSIYGLRNLQALDLQDYIADYSLNTDVFGIMNMPVMRDEKRIQAELSVVAIKKTIEYEISYHQARIRQIALQYIRSAFVEQFFVDNEGSTTQLF